MQQSSIVLFARDCSLNPHHTPQVQLNPTTSISAISFQALTTMYIDYEGLMKVDAWISDSEENCLPELQLKDFGMDTDTYECVT
jgi:hypothetical protein